MSDLRSDADLLGEYVQRGCREALGELIRRYTDLVYSAARRQMRDAHLAEDVAQTVFILLSQNAGKIRQPARLVGWLYQTTYFTAVNALKIQRRRRRHEKAHAAQEQTMTSSPEPDRWDEIAPVLEDAMTQLDRSSRDMLLMRYFQDKTVPQVASEMGLSVDAAQKRLSRALEKLRGLLGRRGVSVSAAAATAVLLNRSVEATPPALHESMVTASASGNAASNLHRQIVDRAKASRTRRIVAAVLIAVILCGALLLWMALPGAPPAAPPVPQSQDQSAQ
ncbi:MAG: sigma-70 family RNA polymerase sigma factor, partial [Tepidisphaeraceae bacterium]